MIIVCGPDNTGKTHLVEHLSKTFNIPKVEKYHTLPPVDYSDWVVWAEKVLLNPNQSIADRFYIEEFVYGPVMRGKIGMTAGHQRHLDKLFADRDPLIIHCDTCFRNISKNYDERVQYPEMNQIKRIQNKFYEVLDSSRFSLMTQLNFDYEFDPHYERIDKAIDTYLKGVCDHECR
jgi:hypothetical protein